MALRQMFVLHIRPPTDTAAVLTMSHDVTHRKATRHVPLMQAQNGKLKSIGDSNTSKLNDLANTKDKHLLVLLVIFAFVCRTNEKNCCCVLVYHFQAV